MPNPYINRVDITRNGVAESLINISDTTAVASDVASGKYFYLATGEKVVGTSGGSGDVSLRELICPQQTVTPSSYMASLDHVAGLFVGGHYVVTYDGTEYVFSAGNLWGGNSIVVGEQTYYYDHSTRTDEIAPFALYEAFNDITRTPKLYAKDNNSHTIKVERIDRDDITTTTICPQQTVTTNSSKIGSLSNITSQFVTGDFYLVTFDGTEWMVTAANLWGETTGVGDDQIIWSSTTDDTVYPFFAYNNGQGMAFYAIDANTSHTIKVEHIDSIPDMIALTTKTITANGTYSAADDSANGYSSVTVNVSGGGGTYQAKTNISPTTSSQTITPDSGYDALSSVQINAIPSGTAGTPSATKGTVSNHAVSVTPSVTNQTGYIAGGTKTGTAVTVSASELVSGSRTITDNGTYDVTAYAQVDVDVQGGGGVSVGKATWSNGSTSTVSHQFTKLSGTPKAAFLRCTSQLTRLSSNTYYYIADIFWDGTNAYGNYHLRSNGSYNNVASDAQSGFNVSVNGTNITFSSDATSRSSAPGSFYNGTYELTYIY